jgi:nuclear pore complex protein Nup98-Nup96
VSVYLLSDDKPPIGQALNRHAKVTLVNVFKRDKATGAPTSDPAVLAKFEKRLRRYCAEMGARFLSYDRSGVWKFEVGRW